MYFYLMLQFSWGLVPDGYRRALDPRQRIGEIRGNAVSRVQRPRLLIRSSAPLVSARN